MSEEDDIQRTVRSDIFV